MFFSQPLQLPLLESLLESKRLVHQAALDDLEGLLLALLKLVQVLLILRLPGEPNDDVIVLADVILHKQNRGKVRVFLVLNQVLDFGAAVRAVLVKIGHKVYGFV